MRSDAKQPNERKLILALMALWLAVGLWVAFGTGCTSTVVPGPVAAGEASFDGGAQNSGIVLSTPSGFVVTDNFRIRYNLLIATYGADFAPPLKPDAGLAPIGEDRWLISKEAMVHFLEMNAWRRAGLKPQNP